MQGQDIVETLLATRVFQGLDKADLQAFADRFQRTKSPAKQVLIEEGQANDTLFIVLSGRFKVLLPETTISNARRFTEVELTKLGPGACFGEFSLFDGQAAGATVACLEPGELITIRRSDFDSVLESSDRAAKTVYRNVIQILINKIREADHECDLMLAID